MRVIVSGYAVHRLHLKRSILVDHFRFLLFLVHAVVAGRSSLLLNALHLIRVHLFHIEVSIETSGGTRPRGVIIVTRSVLEKGGLIQVCRPLISFFIR